MIKYSIFVLGTSAILFACGGDDAVPCTLAGCLDSLTVEFDGDALPAGSSYTLTVVTPDGTVVCTGGDSLIEGGGGSGGASGECTGDFMASLGPSGLHIEGSPKTVGLQLESDGNALADEQLEPQYDRNYPNGKECGGYCQYAVVTVQLAP